MGREFSYNFCSRSDQFIKDFSFKFEGDLNFLVNFFLAGFIFKGVNYMKLKMISIFWLPFFLVIFYFLLCCPLPYSLPSGSSAQTLRTRASARVVTGGRVDGEQKGPLIFFILRYIKHYTHIYLYTKEKLSGQISCGFIFWGVAPTIFKITLLGRHFSKMGLKVDFLEKNNKDFPLKYTQIVNYMKLKMISIFW